MRFLLAGMIILSASAAWAGPLFTLYPDNSPVASNVLAGNDQTVGWGVQITNDDSGYLVIGSLTLTNSLPAPFLDSGFTDLLSFWVANNGRAFAPNETYKLDWSPGTAGFAEFTFPASPFAFTGPTVGVEITYDVFDADPFLGDANNLATGLTTVVDVTLNEADSPEPGTLFTLASGAALLAGLASRRSARSRRP